MRAEVALAREARLSHLLLAFVACHPLIYELNIVLTFPRSTGCRWEDFYGETLYFWRRSGRLLAVGHMCMGGGAAGR